MKGRKPTTERVVSAGILAWVVPGAGHFYLGQRGMAAVFFVAISLPYWTGVALGGVKYSVNPWVNRWLFLAEMGIGGYTTGCYLLSFAGELHPQALADSQVTERIPAETLRKYVSYYPENDVAQIYLAVAGLLNVLAILDALARAQTGGLPVFHHERVASEIEQKPGAR